MSLLCAAICLSLSLFVAPASCGPQVREDAASFAATYEKEHQVVSLRFQTGKERIRVVSYDKDEYHMPIMVWASNGSVLVKGAMDFMGHSLKDCDMVRNRLTIVQFEDEFDKELGNIKPTSLSTSLPHSHITFESFTDLVQGCTIMHESQMRRAAAAKHNANPAQENGVSTNVRRKRDLSKWIWPGTKWCGYGNMAEDERDYGVHHTIDKCCQEHDRCPESIVAFETKYHYSNWQLHTITHCDCDDKFFQCLYNATRQCDAASHLGDFYFNFVQLKCFVIEYEEVCKSRSWWGECNEKGFDYVAKTRHTPTFTV